MTAGIPRIRADSFDYGAIAPGIAAKLQAQATRIRARITKSTKDIVEIGRELLAVKQQLEHGQFLLWVEAEIGISARSAQHYMDAARLAEKSATVAYLQPATVYRLAAKSVPPEVVTEVVSMVEAGENISDAAVNAMISEGKHLRRQAEAKQHRAERRRRKAARQAAQHQVDDDDYSIEDEIEPQHLLTAFLLHADQAVRFAVYSGKATEEVAMAARRAAIAWNELAVTLETQVGIPEDLSVPPFLSRKAH
jgi:hypothetical protein